MDELFVGCKRTSDSSKTSIDEYKPVVARLKVRKYLFDEYVNIGIRCPNVNCEKEPLYLIRSNILATDSIGPN